jgi:CRP-like cAMP-binding protein
MDAWTERRRRTQNRILRALPPDDFSRFSRHVAPVQFSRGDVLADETTGRGRVYFMMSGVCSVVLTSVAGSRIEVASASCEGVTSAFAFEDWGVDKRLIVMVDHASAMRVDRSRFDAEMDRRGALRHLVTGYYRALREEIMLAVACNRFHSARARCCKKLLMLADRGGSETLHLTHAGLAVMLGMTRPSVSVIALDLRRQRVIDYVSGAIVLLNRRELERGACECYHIVGQGGARRAP